MKRFEFNLQYPKPLNEDELEQLNKIALGGLFSRYTSDYVLELEKDLIGYLRNQGLKIYEPDLQAFREEVQQAYESSDYASNWPKGLLERINAL